ncbi:Hypothetical predicted protein [Mytilus galloprovincialis]|uniref:TIR domain-containing protein n=2 Tax=Mytilus galloprovincialis TaxID=29158 RepID=A0A8B6C452_MYTGA|nr:Hypothetical predicted protein [Mytilus galloprovincialis]
MRKNKIEYLRSDTFSGMKYLRNIDLSYNRLRYIEPGLLLNMAASLLNFDVSNNLLTTVDITNILWENQPAFCETDFSFNKITSISNQLDWTCKRNTQFGYGGYVNLSNNNLSHFVKFYKIGFRNIFFLGKLLSYGFDLRENNWICDCQMYLLASKSSILLDKMHRSYFEVTCHSPPELKNVLLIDIIKHQSLDRLICNLTIADRCPPKCRCFYQPSRSRTVVDCSRTGRSGLPSALPLRTDLEIDFSSNRLSSMINNNHETKITGNESILYYYSKYIRKLDLSNNSIEIIPDDLMVELRNVSFINLSKNKMTKISRNLQMFNPCQIYIGEIVIHCKCKDIWLQNWLPSFQRKCYNNTRVYCKYHNKKVHILNMTRLELGCRLYNDFILCLIISLAVAVFIVTVSSLSIYTIRFELFIMTRKFLKYCKGIVVPSDAYTYDIYISCNENDVYLRHWLTSSFVPFLQEKNFSVFLPYRDCQIGRLREEETIDIMSTSLNFVILLSENCESSMEMWIKKEWKYAWYNYRYDINREIIVINYDMMDYQDVTHKFLRAFLKMNSFINFSKKDKLIKAEVYSRLQHYHDSVFGKKLCNGPRTRRNSDLDTDIEMKKS